MHLLNPVIMKWRTKFQERWMQLAARERRAIVIAAPFVLVFILYQFIWSPLLGNVQDLRHRIDTQEKTLAWMQTADLEIQKLAKQTPKSDTTTLSPVALLGVVKNYTKQAGLQEHLKALKQANNDGVEISFQKVDFDRLLQLLIKLTKAESINISQMTTVALSTSGMVNANIILTIA